MSHDEAGTDATLGAYGDAVDLAVKAPTLAGIIVALVSIALVWAWRHLRARTGLAS